MISVQIVGISQEFNFRTKAQENYAVFVLPNGHSFRSLVTDEIAQSLIAMAVGAGGEVSPTAPTMLPSPPMPTHSNEVSAGFVETVDQEGALTHVFGGGETSGQNDSDEAPLVASTITPIRPKYVGKDEYGYPLVSATGGVDPSSVTGSLGDGDEDGIRQA